MSKPKAEGDQEYSGGDNADLEASFPNPERLFAAYGDVDSKSEATLIVLDTSTLLLPYHTRPDDLRAIGGVYESLAAQGRLFVPARAVREFAKNRDRKLSEMLETVNNRMSFTEPAKKIAPLLETIAEHDEVVKAHAQLSIAKKAYVDALAVVADIISRWRGDDPISKLYEGTLRGRVIDGLPIDKLREQWAERVKVNRPPGYKDKSKADGGIGDFLIWSAVLCLGVREKKDVILVTGETKPDWFVKSGGAARYPRVELIDEYKEASSGRTIRLCSLHELLREMKVAETVVQEIKLAEQRNEANNATSASYIIRSIIRGEVNFDYSTHDGLTRVVYGYEKYFNLRFSKASNRSIHIYRDQTAKKIARIRSALPKDPVYIDDLETSSGSYAIDVGEAFAVLNSDDYLLVGRIVEIKDDRRGDDKDLVRFLYAVSPPDQPGEVP